MITPSDKALTAIREWRDFALSCKFRGNRNRIRNGQANQFDYKLLANHHWLNGEELLAAIAMVEATDGKFPWRKEG